MLKKYHRQNLNTVKTHVYFPPKPRASLVGIGHDLLLLLLQQGKTFQAFALITSELNPFETQ